MGWTLEYEQYNVPSFQFSRSVVSHSLQPHESQHARPPCPSPTPRVHPNSCPSSRWYHPAISSCRPLLLLPSIPPSIRVFSLTCREISSGFLSHSKQTLLLFLSALAILIICAILKVQSSCLYQGLYTCYFLPGTLPCLCKVSLQVNQSSFSQISGEILPLRGAVLWHQTKTAPLNYLYYPVEILYSLFS